jgi:glycosyltransferase involved in cell wall biosynthesis
LADVIMVNSEWSRKALLLEGIAAQKIHIVPLPFELEHQHMIFNRTYPVQFTEERPLVCLFLGTLTLRKGIHIVLETAKHTQGRPIEFILVGTNELNIDWSLYPNVSYKGVCSRADTEVWYKQADVFLFPTLSDGFGLTQLEAMAWQLPVVASMYCGEVVTDGINGLILEECSELYLTITLENCLKNPAVLEKLSAQCLDTVRQFSIDRFSEELSILIHINE